MTTNKTQANVQTSVSSIKAALDSLRDQTVHNQALVDCNSLLNLSPATLENHLISWLWQEEDAAAYVGGELLYAIELGKVEECLVSKGLIYND